MRLHLRSPPAFGPRAASTRASAFVLLALVLAINQDGGAATKPTAAEAAVGEGCGDSPHHNCALLVENEDCDAHTKDGEVIGETICRASCGRCDDDAYGTTDAVTTDAGCYAFGQQEITLSFRNIEPQKDDWVGVYEATTTEGEDDGEPAVLGGLSAWSWLCGNKRDQCKVGAGSVTVPWLPPGTYRAIMARNDHHSRGPLRHGKERRYAESPMFEVVRGGVCSTRRVEKNDVVGINRVDEAQDNQSINLRRRKQ
jgi:hypothetical protein